MRFNKLIKLTNMSILEYKPTNLDRVNPEFVGIAEKYSQHKKKRLEIQSKRNHLHHHLRFKVYVDQFLQKNLDSKKQELENVISIHQRVDNDKSFKAEIQSKNNAFLNELKRTAHTARSTNKHRINYALSQTRQKNKNDSKQLKELFTSLRLEHSINKMNRSEENKNKFKTIKNGEKMCHNTVNQFYQQKNQDSLNTYKKLIQNQQEKSKILSNEADSLANSITLYDDKIDKKKQTMYEVLQKISLYSLQPLESQERCLPQYLRQHKTASSRHSSRPSDLLLKGATNLMKFESTESNSMVLK